MPSQVWADFRGEKVRLMRLMRFKGSAPIPRAVANAHKRVLIMLNMLIKGLPSCVVAV
jgi:hypothetical protein